VAITSAQITVGTTALLVSGTETDSRLGQSVSVANTGATTVYLGPAAVTTATGFPLAANGYQAVDLDTGEALYAVVASGTCVVGVLRTGV
jgi:hypothetical protein